MIRPYKVIFLPIDKRILDLFNGYILDGELLPDVKESDVYTEINHYEFEGEISKTEWIFRIFILILLIPIIIVILVIAFILKRFDSVVNKSSYYFEMFFNFFFKKKKILRTRLEKSMKYKHAIKEDIPTFLNHCKKKFTKVYLYSYYPLTNEEELKVRNLIRLNGISGCQSISKLSDLIPFINLEGISILNSLLVIRKTDEISEAILLGFHLDNGLPKNIELWDKTPHIENARNRNDEINSFKSVIKLHGKIDFFWKVKSTAFFPNNYILFIQNVKDDFLSSYIQKNLKNINDRLSKKGMELLYYPSFISEKFIFQNQILAFLRYRYPFLYTLTDSELNAAILICLQKITPEEFYLIAIEELGLPLFYKPCLVRSISGGDRETENKFTYKYIEYQTEKHLDDFFEKYIHYAKIPDNIQYGFKLSEPSDFDWSFDKESKQETEEFKLQIDSIKAEGKYGVLAEAIIYMLESIKDDKPEMHSKFKTMLEKRKSLESKVILSPILIDKHYNIFLPDFGNIEVKMHALPKTLYIFFLRHLNGVRFKEIYQHKIELLKIYNQITNKYDNEEIHRAINDLVDMTKPNINMQCSRIRAAFRGIMDEHIAKYYYIDGVNGEPKKIALPQNLIDIRY